MVTMRQISLMKSEIFNLKMFSEYREAWCHRNTPLEGNNYLSMIEGISFICYAKYCH